MKHLTLVGMLMLWICVTGQAQYTMTVEATDAVQTGLTTYRFYVNMTDATDRMSAVYGNNDATLQVSAPAGAYNNSFNTSWNASGLNPAFLNVYPEMADDTYATIGLVGPASFSGIPNAADPAIVEDSTQPITPFFLQANATELLSNTLIGSSWYILNTAGNGLPNANLQVLVLQVTTSGTVSGQVNFQVFPLGVGANEVQMIVPFDGPGTFSGQNFLDFGCTDELACNYDENAVEDDGSCDYTCVGCMDETACNYDAAATIEGECQFLDALGICGGDCEADTNNNGQCDDTEIAGCINENACNYNPDATLSNGTCDFLSCLVFGCTDPTACNYDPDADYSDGSCTYETPPYDCDGNCINDDDGDGVCNELEVFGCTDEDACNYDVAATEDSGNCTYPTAPFDCNGDCVNDFNNNGVCDEFEGQGCTDVDACNYDNTATEDNGSCEFESCAGCMDETACNYDMEATIEDNTTCEYAAEFYDCDGVCLMDADGDGVCDELEVLGCDDMDACNYDMAATDNDGSCEYAADYYNCDGVCLMDTDGDGVCDELEVLGCDDMDACNYDMAATDNDGSCEYAADFYDCEGACLMDTDGDGVCDELEVLGCDDQTACNYDMVATENDGSCVYADEFYDCDGVCLMDADGDGVCDELEVAGCTDMTACNYDMAATDDDGSCEFESCAGCMDVTACNYDMEATIEDNASCEYAVDYYDCEGNCLMDVDGDGVCDELEVVGCTDMAACNYNELATDDDGTCEYPAEAYLDCDGNCINDQDGDGVCDELEVEGCTNMDACNYDELATDEDGSCILVGDTCDDGDENTINDTIDENCDCVGEVDGVEEARLAFGMFPNPTTGQVTLTVAGFHTGVTVQVLDGAGRVVWTEQNMALQGNTVMDLSGLSSGTYNVMLSDERGVSVKRLAIQR